VRWHASCHHDTCQEHGWGRGHAHSGNLSKILQILWKKNLVQQTHINKVEEKNAKRDSKQKYSVNPYFASNSKKSSLNKKKNQQNIKRKRKRNKEK
jgi:hypothetical protein